MPANYILADVFTDRAFGGNQLAVFPDAAGIAPERMQAMARELNLAESTFVTPGDQPGHFNMRIFTPATELKFAGHPTVGTAVVLAGLGRVPAGMHEIVLHEGVGPVRVALGPGRATLFMDGAPETRPVPVPGATIAAALGVPALAGEPWQGGYGTAFLYAPLPDIATLGRAMLRLDQWEALAPQLWGHGVYAYVATAPGTARARMFGAGLGIHEDPATGSAAAPLVAVLSKGNSLNLVITQGVEMGRPSTLECAAVCETGQVKQVSVGGGAVVVGEGRFTLPS